MPFRFDWARPATASLAHRARLRRRWFYTAALIWVPLGVAAQTPPSAEQQADRRPTVAVMYFTNGALTQHADFEPLTKGVAAVLIEELQTNDSIRVIEREYLQQILQEQKLTETKSVDPSTAVQIGKLLGARYMIFGGFLVDMKGRMSITARAVNVETSEIAHVEKVEDKADNVLAMLSTLAQKMNKGLRLPSMPAQARPGGSAGTATGSLDDLRRYARAADTRDVATATRDTATTQKAIALYKDFLAKAPTTMVAQRNAAEKQIAVLARGM
jgi:TolB-like protein